MWRTIASLTACAALISACAHDTRTDRQTSVALFTDLSTGYIRAQVEGVEDAARRRNARVRVFDAQLDPQRQARQIQDAVASGRYDAFVVTPIDSSSVVPAVTQAVAAGIETVALTAPIGRDPNSTERQVEGVVASVMANRHDTGRNAGELVIGACAGRTPCTYAWLAGSASAAFERQALKDLDDGLKDHPGIRRVAVRQTRYQPDLAFQATREIVQREPNLDVIATVNDAVAIGAEKALVRMERLSDVELAGLNGSRAGVAAVRDGRWFGTSASVPVDAGRWALELAVDAVRGRAARYQWIDPVARAGLPKLLTRSNLAEWRDFRAQFAG